jgi:hypothetical protein
LRDRQQPNHDLFLEYKHAAQSLNNKVEWIKDHQNRGHQWEDIRDLAHLQLTPAAYLNIWCDAAAAKHNKCNISAPDADVLPIKKWAVYSCYPITRKITGNLEHGIHDSMYSNSLYEYIRKKHSLCSTKLENVHTDSLKSYMGRLNILKRANVAKLIHRWIPIQEEASDIVTSKQKNMLILIFTLF